MGFRSQTSLLSPTSRLSGGGLDYITSSTFSAASTVSVDGCFTATYENYLLIANYSGSTTATNTLRMRASGSDSATAIYDRGQFYYDGTVGGQSVNATGFDYHITTSNLSRWLRVEILGPALSQNTKIIMHAGETSGTVERATLITGTHKAASAYDGCSIVPGAGTITGTLHVYGYRKA